MSNTYFLEKKIILILSILLLFLSSLSFFSNQWLFQYQGHNYFPEGSFLLGITLLLILFGCMLQFGRNSFFYLMTQEILVFYFIMGLVVFITNAAQYTPFNPIDRYLIIIEKNFHLSMLKMMYWTNQCPLFKKILMFSYQSINYQLFILPLIMIFLKEFKKVYSYYFFLLITALIGFVIYYFFPTTAPASNFKSSLFSEYQYATGLKFHQIHHHLSLTTIDGGMVSFPSFHVIWAWLCLYLVSDYKLFFFPLLLMNSLMMISCVFLGWHYWIDIVGSLFVILISHWIYWFFKKYSR